MQKKLLIFITFLFFLGSALRLWQLGSIPTGLYWDEIAMLVDAKTVASTGHDMHGNLALQAMFPSYGDYKLPVYIWLSAITVKIFGVSAFALRLPSAILGILQIVLVFKILQELTKTSKKHHFSYLVPYLGAFLIASAPWSILFSRTGFEGHAGQFFLTLGVYALLKSKHSRGFLIIAVFSSVVAVYCYYSVRFVWPVVLLLYWLTQQILPSFRMKRLTASTMYPLLCLFIWVLAMIPLFTSPYYKESQQFRLSTDSVLTMGPFIQQSNKYREIAGNTVFSRLFYHYRLLQLRALITHYSDHLDFSYLFLRGDPNLRHSTGHHGLFQLWTAVFLIAGLSYLLLHNKALLLFLLGWWSIALLPASVPLNTPHALRSLNALSPIILIMSFGCLPLASFLFRKHKVNVTKIFLILGAFVIMYQNASFIVDYFVVYRQESGSEWQQGYKEVIDAIDADYQKVDTIWVNIEDDRFYLWYLGFGRLSAQEIQKLTFEKYMLKEVGKIRFKPFMWKGYETQAKPLIVVARAGQLEKAAQKTTVIKDTFGNPKFEIGVYEK